MSLISLLIWLIILGLVLYLINTLPIDPTLKRIIHIVVVVIVVLWLLQVLGVLGGLGDIRIGSPRV
jgi:hypothetical protein